MKRKFIGRGFILGFLSSVIVIVLNYLVTFWASLPFAPFRLFDFMARILPGGIITFGIDLIVSVIDGLQLGPTSEVAKLAEQSMAIVQFMVLGGLLGIYLGYIESQKAQRGLSGWGLLGGFILGVAFVLIELYLGSPGGNMTSNLIWLGLLMMVWGLVLDVLIKQVIRSALAAADQPTMSRREVLYWVGTALAALIASIFGLGSLLLRREREGDKQASSKAALTPPSDEGLTDRIQPAPGTRPEITANEDFYRIDINTMAPQVDAQNWRLELDGLVENPMSLTLEDIRARPRVSEYITLTCISNRIGGDLISTSQWAGISLKDLLDEAGLMSEARELAIEPVDGFYESVSMEDMMDARTFLVYEMNGQPLPHEHGFPLRIYIPNRYGMKQPKWITKMSVIAEEGPGYWVDRGWSEEAFVRTTSVVDNAAVEQTGDGVILSGGIAFSGARGISRVEIQIDDGAWNEAVLRTPPLSPLTWVQWRHQAEVQPGEHIARVRAYDMNGELQIQESHPPHPDGAAGIHTLSFDV
jgi:DMSO/TMAO reductase YedYZ molybdopterin-dependent catalytic subunit